MKFLFYVVIAAWAANNSSFENTTTTISQTENQTCDQPKVKKGCDEESGPVFGSSVKCKNECSGFKEVEIEFFYTKNLLAVNRTKSSQSPK